MFEPNSIQQRQMEDEASEFIPERLRLQYSTLMLDFIYWSQSKLQDADIDTSFFLPQDWLFIRRHMPILNASLDNVQKDILNSVKDDLLSILSDIGLAVLIIWLSRKKGGKTQIEGDSNIVGDNNQVKFSKSINNITVMVGARPSSDEEAIPILAIYQPEGKIKFFPLADGYRRIDEHALKNAMAILNGDNRKDRLNAIRTIKDAGNEKYAQRIIPRVLDSDPIVQGIAADVVAEHNCTEAIPVLLKALVLKETPYAVKEALAFSLIELGGSSVVQPLVKIYKNGKPSPEYLSIPMILACLKSDDVYKAILDQAMSGSKENKIGAIRLLDRMFSEQQFNFAS